ncbi:MAG: LamG domain-containing protein [bacterium]|nr:LamG domain-containing protein [bacterium]
MKKRIYKPLLIIAIIISVLYIFTGCSTAEGDSDDSPTPGNSGTITVSNLTATSLTITWGAATDGTTAEADLQYLAYYSSSDSMSTVAEIEANGTAIGSYAAATYTKDVTTMAGYFNVIVKDADGEKAAYSMFTEYSRSGLRAYYPFNGDANDESANSNNGTNSGAALFTDRHSSASSAYDFDGGGDTIWIPNTVINNMTSGTFTAWINLDTRDAEVIVGKHHNESVNCTIFSIGSYASSDGTSFTTGTTGILYFHGHNGVARAASSSAVSTGAWTHVAVSFTNSSVTFYINGTASGSTSGDYSVSNNLSGTLYTTIGYWASASYPVTDGRIDDVRIYSRAFSASEVSELYNMEKP